MQCYNIQYKIDLQCSVVRKTLALRSDDRRKKKIKRLAGNVRLRSASSVSIGNRPKMKRKRYDVLMMRLVRLEYVLQKELEKEIKKVADRQTELSADVHIMRKDVSTEFDKYNSSQGVFRKQLQV